MKAKRQSTVEPVFGTLTQFRGLRKINTIGIQQANKVMHLAATAYNLKKYLKFTSKTVKSEAKAMAHLFLTVKSFFKQYNRIPILTNTKPNKKQKHLKKALIGWCYGYL